MELAPDRACRPIREKRHEQLPPRARGPNPFQEGSRTILAITPTNASGRPGPLSTVRRLRDGAQSRLTRRLQ
jgi:hypothetical protein